jgi:hypothetical protein
MKPTKSRIKEVQQIIAAQCLLSYAPDFKRALTKELGRLLMEESVERAIWERLEERLKTFKQELQLAPAAAGPAKAEEVQARSFMMSTFFLSESFAYLRRQPEESLHLATGVAIGNTFTVETLVPVALSHATVVAAEADRAALSRILASLDRLGHCLTGVFHIHTGEGIGATTPSSVDHAYMQRLAGRALVFGIWSRDGYCRVMTLPADTTLQIYGDGIAEARKENHAVIYKLNTSGESLLGFGQRSAERVVVGRKLVRPAGTDPRV